MKIERKKVLNLIIKFILLLLFVSFIAFVLMDISPIDPIAAFARSKNVGLTNEQKQMLIEEWGLDRPILSRYFSWIKNILRGNLGVSNIYGIEVSKIIKRGFSSSILLMSAAWIFQGILGFVLGIISGVKRNTLIDKIIKAYAIILSATPTYWVGIVLITIFSLKLGIFPASMAAPIGIESYKVTIFDRLYHLILPAITLALVGTANIILHTREKVIEILNSDYCLYAKSKGLSDFKIIKNFALKNIMLPAITLQFSYFSELFSGTILAENVFNYPGLGNLTVQAGLRGDLPLLLGLVLFSAIFVFLGNRMADLFYIIIDPQMREKA